MDELKRNIHWYITSRRIYSLGRMSGISMNVVFYGKKNVVRPIAATIGTSLYPELIE